MGRTLTSMPPPKELCSLVYRDESIRNNLRQHIRESVVTIYLGALLSS